MRILLYKMKLSKILGFIVFLGILNPDMKAKFGAFVRYLTIAKDEDAEVKRGHLWLSKNIRCK
jgi:hypothetical protein